jgi:transposase
MARSLSRRRGSRIKAGGRSAIGAPALSLSEADAAIVVAEACRPPQDVGVPVTQWSAELLGDHLRTHQIVSLSDRTVSRILHDAALQPHRQKMWLTSQDEDFREQRDEILRLYYNTPQHQHLICLDEKTGMQALERKRPDLPMRSGKPLRRDFEYIRHGTLCLMGGYDVRARKLFGFMRETHSSDAFVELMDEANRYYPTGRGHFICDNLSAHDTDDVVDWLEDHPRWTLHFTPRHASWLNQIECAFSILHRHVLARGSFRSVEELQQRIEDYMFWFNQQVHSPFNWTYRPNPRMDGHICGGRY